jgi:hypothetical protein
MITLTATITKLNGEFINLDYRNSLSLERNIQDRSDISMPSYGIISNGGSLRFIDADGSIRSLAEQRQLKSGMAVNFSLNNTSTNASAPVGEFLTVQWDYDKNNKQVFVAIRDELEEWQEILFTPIKYNPYFEKDLSFEWLYKYLYELTPSKYSMLEFEELDDVTKSIISNSKFEFFILEANNLWSAWTHLCQACLCHIYKTNNGRTVCRYNGGN